MVRAEGTGYEGEYGWWVGPYGAAYRSALRTNRIRLTTRIRPAPKNTCMARGKTLGGSEGSLAYRAYDARVMWWS